MDIHLIPGVEATAEERAAVDDLLGPRSETSVYGSAVRFGQEAREDRHLLLPALWAVQRRIGFISPGALNYICEQLMVPPAEAYGVASFYALFSLEPTPPRVVHVCDDLACRVNGAREVCRALEERVGHDGAPTVDGAATWKRSPCLGMCERAPVAFVQQAGPMPIESTVVSATAESIIAAVLGETPQPPPVAERNGSAAAPQTAEPERHILRLLSRVGQVDPTSLDEYRAAGGYAALRRAFEIGPVGVIREVTDSGLLGRGGAAFPTGLKWQAVAASPVRPHYLVANADESESGTFKDRVLMEEDPFATVEAMTIAGYATGCERGYLYIRGEYSLATSRLQSAIDVARRRGFLGKNIMDEGMN
ncbi:MAG: NAD(P)H-dependent oxidoreductase subunit E, partial [Thermomicrobiales bacterium]